MVIIVVGRHIVTDRRSGLVLSVLASAESGMPRTVETARGQG
jgi:hypothetical protein